MASLLLNREVLTCVCVFAKKIYKFIIEDAALIREKLEKN